VSINVMISSRGVIDSKDWREIRNQEYEVGFDLGILYSHRVKIYRTCYKTALS